MDEELLEQCRRGAMRLLAQKGWQLVRDEAAFVEEVLAEVEVRLQRVRGRPLDKIIEDATVNLYCHLWHEACKAPEKLRQRRAFIELHAYLYPIACYRAKRSHRVAEESTQEALVKVWQNLDRVRDPGCFARYASQILLREASTIERRHEAETSQVDLGRPGDPETIAEPVTRGLGQHDPTTRPPEQRIVSGEIQAQLRAAIERCLHRSPDRQAVIIGLFLEQKGFKELADELRTSVQNVYLLKSRALERLRECEQLLEVLLGALEA